MIKLTALELVNFQSIRKHTTIPIRDLTLMFGPNGAGKSSVYDAIELLKVIFNEEWGSSSKKLSDLLERWAFNKNPNKSIGVGLQFYVDDEWSVNGFYESFNLYDLYKIHTASSDDYKTDFCGQTFRIFIEFDKTYNDYYWKISQFQISNDLKQFLAVDTIQSTNKMDFNRVRLFKQDWIDYTIIDKSIGIKKSKISDDEYIELFYNKYLEEIKSGKWFSDTSQCQIDNYLNDRDAHNAAEELICQIIDFFKIFVNNAMNWNRDELIRLIQGSRTVPTPSELIFLISGAAYLQRKTSISDEKFISPQLISNNKALDATRKKLNQELNEWEIIARNYALDKYSESNEDLKDFREEKSVTKKINLLLSEELFIDQGYQISGVVKCLVDIEELIDYDITESITYPKLVNLFLIGPNGKHVEINDVGSGVGYVLPVLSSLARNGISLIQQPELHLHPALQSALGTAIVKCIENKTDYNAFSLIETHSEHILLRIMRLLKSSKYRLDEVIKPLDFENIAILYFQPQGDGTSIVKRLRLSPDGQLVDRWPGGFFEERYKDIFDV